MSKVYWLNTKWACGAISFDENRVLDKSATCPYFIKVFRGKKYSEVMNRLKKQKALYGLKLIEED